jgi:hypothetical protein
MNRATLGQLLANLAVACKACCGSGSGSGSATPSEPYDNTCCTGKAVAAHWAALIALPPVTLPFYERTNAVAGGYTGWFYVPPKFGGVDAAWAYNIDPTLGLVRYVWEEWIGTCPSSVTMNSSGVLVLGCGASPSAIHIGFTSENVGSFRRLRRYYETSPQTTLTGDPTVDPLASYSAADGFDNTSPASLTADFNCYCAPAVPKLNVEFILPVFGSTVFLPTYAFRAKWAGVDYYFDNGMRCLSCFTSTRKEDDTVSILGYTKENTILPSSMELCPA